MAAFDRMQLQDLLSVGLRRARSGRSAPQPPGETVTDDRQPDVEVRSPARPRGRNKVGAQR